MYNINQKYTSVSTYFYIVFYFKLLSWLIYNILNLITITYSYLNSINKYLYISGIYYTGIYYLGTYVTIVD